MTRGDDSWTPTSAPADIFRGCRFEHRQPLLERSPAEARDNLLRIDAAVPDRERLVEQRERVPGRATRPAGNEVEHFRIGLDPLPAENVGQEPDDLFVREQRELEVLRARTQCRQHLLRIGRGEYEHDVLGRLFERLQQRVRCGRGEHVHFVDDVDLAPARGADAEVHPLDELAHRVDTVVRRRVELDEIEERARGHRKTVLAGAVGLTVGAEVQAVQGTSEDAGGRGLAGASGAGEQVRVAHTIFSYRVAERGRDVVLTHQIARILGPVLAVQALRRHGGHLTDAH